MTSFTHNKRIAALLLCMVLMLGVLTGCASQGSESEGTAAATTDTFYVVVAGTYVSEEAVTAYAETLRSALPELQQQNITLDVSAISVGDTDADPMGAMAGITRMTALMASHEMDLLIADPSNGARNARSEAFVPLSELSGLDDYASRVITIHGADDEGNVTAEVLPDYGIDLSDNASLSALISGGEVGAYVVNPDKAETAVTIINYLMAGGTTA